MTNKEAANILLNIYQNEVQMGGRGCGKTAFRNALLIGANAINLLETYKWERDIAIEQLEELGIGFGRKIDGVYLTKEEYDKLLEYKAMYEDLCE